MARPKKENKLVRLQLYVTAKAYNAVKAADKATVIECLEALEELGNSSTNVTHEALVHCTRCNLDRDINIMNVINDLYVCDYCYTEQDLYHKLTEKEYT
jgi:hypothetical protein